MRSLFEKSIKKVSLLNERSLNYLIIVLLCLHFGCRPTSTNKDKVCSFSEKVDQRYALMASKFEDLEALKELVRISYQEEKSLFRSKKKSVELNFCSRLGDVYSSMSEGMSQAEILDAKRSNFTDKLEVLYSEPRVIQNRKHLKDIFLLARRRYDLYTYGDPAFYDLSLAAFEKTYIDSNLLSARDLGEKGLINTFNHITGQAMVSSIYSAELADLVADLHERQNMPELIDGNFSEAQLNDSLDNPVDNYVDMVNNEVGQMLGRRLKEKYQIRLHQQWTPKLLCDYLNDLQEFYSRAFHLKMLPFREDEEVVRRFCVKLNTYYQLKHNII